MDDDFRDRLFVRLGHKLSALTLGTLTKAERRSLHDELFQTREGRHLWSLFRPFTAREKARILARVKETLRLSGSLR